MKITEKIQAYEERKKPFYSFEYFPPKTDFGLENLYSRLARMANLEPAFVDITWGAGGSTSDLTLEMSGRIQRYFGLDVLMHLTCTNLSREKILRSLETARSLGVQNILALRGDPPQGSETWEKVSDGLENAANLVRLIRENFGDTFAIGVAGYPEGHPDSEGDWKKDAHFLKEKIDCGADFVITQLFYDPQAFLRFRDYCHEIGIRTPIIPGIMPIHNFSRFEKFAQSCKVAIPPALHDRLAPVKNDDAKVTEVGIEYCFEMCNLMLKEGIPGLHFYTLNLENAVTDVLVKLKLSEDSRVHKAYPWRQATLDGRQQTEQVRPIYWSNRPESYLARTSNWDDFPNGRWGDSRSPTFGELSDYHLIRGSRTTEKAREDRRKAWGFPNSQQDVFEVFAQYCSGKVDRLPWSDSILQSETSSLREKLIMLNRKGFLTINSQPKVFGAASTDATVGWGGPGGYVFQKAYLEFFTSPENWSLLEPILSGHSSLTWQSINQKGNYHSNMKPATANAVTWGVFPGREVVQPTVVDTESFKIWREEAFDLWLSDWASIYDKDSFSRKVIEKIHDTFVLVNMVDNDFISGDLYQVFQTILDSEVNI